MSELPVPTLSRRRLLEGGLTLGALAGLGITARMLNVFPGGLALPPDTERVISLELNQTPYQPIMVGAAFDRNALSCSSTSERVNPYSIINLYHDNQTILTQEAQSAITSVAHNGQIPMISLGLVSENNDGCFRITRDIKDTLPQLKTAAYIFAHIPSEIYLRFAYEMNGDWMGYGAQVNSVQSLISLFQFTSELMHKISPNVKMVWSPNVGYESMKFYPGDRFVDVVAFDNYNKYKSSILSPAHANSNSSFYDQFAPSVAAAQHGMRGKPILIAETNIAESVDDLRIAYFQDAIRQAASWRNVIGLCGFFWDKQQNIFDIDPYETNWSVPCDPFTQMLLQHPQVHRAS